MYYFEIECTDVEEQEKMLNKMSFSPGKKIEDIISRTFYDFLQFAKAAKCATCIRCFI